jgi:hypothetical protein
MNSTCTTPANDIERQARRRAGAHLGWCIHATVYVAVNSFLVLLATSSGRSWAIFPLLGWGLGLAIHGLVVFLRLGGGGIHQRLVDQERRRLTTGADPW